MKTKVILALVLILPIAYIMICNRKPQPVRASEISLPARLSAFKLFKGDPKLLVQGQGVEIQELSSALFTDYAHKQRLLKLPPGKKMIIKGNGLPEYPEGTLLAKTFYYEKNEKQPGSGRQIIETRILLLKNGKWNAGTYQWNTAQSEAFYIPDTANIPVNWTDQQSRSRKVSYHIPGAQECISCHQLSGQIVPIGPKAMNLNRMVSRNGKDINQLVYLQNQGWLQMDLPVSKVAKLPAYENPQESLEHRARAYLEINCAHCHQPGGLASRQSVMFGYQVPFPNSGIDFNKENITGRMATKGEYHMPKLGTTIIHEEGFQLIRDYLKSIQ